MSISYDALLEGLSEALAVICSSRLADWPISDDTQRAVQEFNTTPTIHQLLVLHENYKSMWSQIDAAEQDASCDSQRPESFRSYHQMLNQLDLDIEHARNAANVAERMQLIARLQTNTPNVSIKPLVKSATFDTSVVRVIEESINSPQSSQFLSWTKRNHTMDLPANHAGGFREYLTLVCRQPARNWLVELHCAIIYCLQRERGGLGRHGKRLSSLNPDDDLLDELSDALAARVVCESMDADPLSPSSIERLMQKYVKSCSKTRSESITRIKSALTCLWNLCQNIYINDDRKLVDGSILSADSYELLCELVGLSGEWGPPSVLERALVKCRIHVTSGVDILTTLKGALKHPSGHSNCLTMLCKWTKEHGSAMISVLNVAFQFLDADCPSVPLNLCSTDSSVPFLKMVRPKQTEWSVCGPKPSYVHIQDFTLHTPENSNLYLPYEQHGLSPKQFLSHCLLCVLWELLHFYQIAPPFELMSQFVVQTFEVAKNEAQLVTQLIEYERAHNGSFVQSALERTNKQLMMNDGEMANTIAVASYALRHIDINKIWNVLNNLERCEQHVVEHFLTSIGKRLSNLLGINPMHSTDKGTPTLSPRYLVQLGIINSSTSAIMNNKSSNTHLQQSRILYSHVHKYYGMNIIAQLIGFSLPPLYQMRLRCSCSPLAPTPYTKQIEIRTLWFGLATIGQHRNCIIKQSFHQHPLLLTKHEWSSLPQSCKHILMQYMVSKPLGQVSPVRWIRPRTHFLDGTKKQGPWLLRIDPAIWKF